MSFDSTYNPHTMPRDGAYDVHYQNYLYQQTDEYKQQNAYKFESISQLKTIFDETFPPGEAINIPAEALGDPYDNNFHAVVERTLNIISNREHSVLPRGLQQVSIDVRNKVYLDLEDNLKHIVYALKSETDQSLKQEVLKDLVIAFTYPCFQRWTKSVNQSLQIILETQNSI